MRMNRLSYPQSNSSNSTDALTSPTPTKPEETAYSMPPPKSIPFRVLWIFLNLWMWGLGEKYAVRVHIYAQLQGAHKINVWRDDQQKEWDRMSVAVRDFVTRLTLLLKC